MKKSLVETTSAFMLVDPMTRDEVAYNRPSVVGWSTFIEARVGAGQVRVLAGGIPKGVTDADFVAVLKASDGKLDLAIPAFLAEFAPPDVPGSKVPAATLKPPVSRVKFKG